MPTASASAKRTAWSSWTRGCVVAVVTRSFSWIALYRGRQAGGKRLYAHNEIDHPRLFEMLAGSGADFLMTYDRTPEIESLIDRHGFHAVRVLMKNTHHARIPELVITPRPVFLH